MIKKLHKLNQFQLIPSKASKLIGTLIILLSGYASAQYKIDPKFEQLIQQKNKGLDSKLNLKKYNEDNQLSTSTIIKPNGEVEELYHVVIYTESANKLKDSGIIVQSVTKKFVTALVSLDNIQQLAKDNNVTSVMVPTIDYLTNEINVTESGADLLHSGILNNTAYTGKDVIVGIFDTGIDYNHPDFRDPNDQTKSRILKIWDQTLTPISGESSPNVFAVGNYGVEYTQAQINDEIDGTPANFIRQKDLNGHGTHVAATAAGNGAAFEKKIYKGAAPEANIVFVKGGDGSFPTNNSINALDYFKKISEETNMPIVVNMSIGSQGTPHDGNNTNEIKVNEFTESGPGRLVVISAGNDGNGKIHQRLDLKPGEKKKISFSALNTTTTSNSLFSFVTYNKGLQNNKEINVTLTAPDGNIYTQGPNGENTSTYTKPGSTGSISMKLRNYFSSANLKRFTEFIVSRSSTTITTDGTYVLEYENISAEDITVDGWIYSKNISVSLTNGDNNYTIGSPGTANNAITVANHVGKSFVLNRSTGTYSYSTTLLTQTLNPSSSKGPRADEVRKPDISTDGTNVVSALSTSSPNTPNVDGKYYTTMTGTSMSSPGVAGAVALLLQANKNIKYSDVKKRLIENTIKDEFTGQDYTPEYGYGKLNIYQAVSNEINQLNGNTNCLISNFTTLGYDNLSQGYTTASLPSSYQFYFGDQNGPNYGRMAVKYTSNMTGKLGSVYAMLGYNLEANKVIPFTINIRKVDKDGNPGDIIGSKKYADMSNYNMYEWANFDVSDLNINVNYNEDFFIEIYSDVRSLRLFYDKTNIDKRTYTSSDLGTTYTISSTLDAKIRAIVYENDPAVKQLASITKTAKQAVALGYNYFLNGCELITRVESSGASPITGNTTAKVWIDSTVKDYVQRRIEVNAENNNTTSTGKVTLFYTQADFDAYNNTNAALKLPTSNTDTENKKNLFVQFFTGTSKDNTGSPSSYNNNSAVTTNVAAENVIWNNTYKYWEVTVDAIGFGGYLLTTDKTLGNIENSLNSLSLYPNPVINDLTINLPTNIKNAQIKIVDVTGRTVSNSNVTISNNKVDVSKLSQGVYIVEITTDKGTISKKIIKK